MRFSLPYYQTTALSRNSHSVTTPECLLRYLELPCNHHSYGILEQCHAQLLSLGYSENLFLATKLISVYASVGATAEAKLIFDGIRQTSVCVYNSLINGLAKSFAHREVFLLFNSMCRSGIMPDGFTLSALSKVSGETGNLSTGKSVHGKIVKNAFVYDVVVANSIMSMYCKHSSINDCLKVFDEMPHRSIGSWNVVVSGFVNSGKKTIDDEVLRLIKHMQKEGLKPNSITLSSLLCLCKNADNKRDYGRELHGYSVRNELALPSDTDLHIHCCLIDMYSSSGRVSASRLIFDKMKNRNIVTWTAIVNCYAQSGEVEEALRLFREMQNQDWMEPNTVSLVTVLPLCSELCSLRGGKQVHGFSIRKEIDHNTSLSNALIDMYCKCGCMTSAKNVFDNEFFHRDSISWGAIICGYGIHGKGLQAVTLYNQMLEFEEKPDPVSILGVLTACSKSGLITEGIEIFYTSKNFYGIKPTVEICACVVDMLARSGQLDSALEFIKSMPMEPGPSVWGSLLSSSILHGNLEMQDLAYRFLSELEPENPSNYVSLSNLSASSRQWTNVAHIRAAMKEMGMHKTPGCSWITISSSTHCFYAADQMHPRCEMIYELNNGLIVLMKEALDFHTYDNVT